jgi:HSP90 family molecular chaperone
MKRDSTAYDAWFKDFNVFLKEGIMSDYENREQLLRLMRYHSTINDCTDTVSLDDYVKSMKENQKKIYYISSLDGDVSRVLESPFMEPFK